MMLESSAAGGFKLGGGGMEALSRRFAAFWGWRKSASSQARMSASSKQQEATARSTQGLALRRVKHRFDWQANVQVLGRASCVGNLAAGRSRQDPLQALRRRGLQRPLATDTAYAVLDAAGAHCEETRSSVQASAQHQKHAALSTPDSRQLGSTPSTLVLGLIVLSMTRLVAEAGSRCLAPSSS